MSEYDGDEREGGDRQGRRFMKKREALPLWLDWT